MKNIAITGSFAVGKTHIINCIKNLGYKVFSCDEYVKKLYQDQSITNLIQLEIKELKVFDKDKLAYFIYTDDNIRSKIEKIIHPLVREGVKKFELDYIGEDLIFTEVPLLFESGFDKYFSKIICVYCLEKTREERAKKRLINNLEFFDKIKKIQLPQEIKLAKSDFTIDSEGEIEEEIIKIINIIK